MLAGLSALVVPVAAPAEHATWLDGRLWRRSAAAVAAPSLARELAGRGVRWVFPRAGTLRRAGGAPRAGRVARRFTRALREAGLRVLPWVVGYAHRHLGRTGAWLERTARGLARLVARSGADGVHLDVEPPFGSFGQIPGAWLAALAARVRALRPDALISFAIHPVRTPAFPRGLDPAEVRPLLRVADQVVVMMYDTAIADPGVFARAIAEQVEALGDLAAGGRARLWMGAAAYPRHRARRFRHLHRPEVENVAATASALRSALRLSPHRTRWMGVAVFAEYSAQPEDWEALGRAWGGDPRR